MIEIRQKGSFANSEKMLKRSIGRDYQYVLQQYGKEGVAALSAATPIDTGKTANSWTYDISKTADSLSVVWKNTNINRGVNIAIILQYGHATRNGGYVQGIDYINPALRPIFEEMADKAWKEVTAS